MKKSAKVCLLSSFFIIFLCSFIGNVAAVETYGYEWCRCDYSGYQHHSAVKFQTEVVYVETDQGGVTPYGIWVNTRNYNPLGGSAKTIVRVYAMVKYRDEVPVYPYTIQEYWAAAPAGLLQWNNDNDYNVYPQETWTWQVGIDVKSFKFGASYTSGPTINDGSGSGFVGSWRYLGWIQSEYSPWFWWPFIGTIYLNGNHDFNALMRIHIVNSVASDWVNGILVSNYYPYLYRWITEIRFRIDFLYYNRLTSNNWYLVHTFSHIIGDGNPLATVSSDLGLNGITRGGTDLNYIPLEIGTAG